MRSFKEGEVVGPASSYMIHLRIWSQQLMVMLAQCQQVKMKVSWQRFHPDITSSSWIEQIVARTPTDSQWQCWTLA